MNYRVMYMISYRQEEIAAELEKESQLTEVGLGESNSQLNTGEYHIQ